MKRLRSPLTSPWMTGVLAICGGLAAPAAHAENQPYYISAQQRFSHTDIRNARYAAVPRPAAKFSNSTAARM